MNFELFHLQIMTGGLPYMTKGPLAMFFGGHEILPELSDRKAGRHIQILCLVSVVFNLSIFCRNKFRKLTNNNVKKIPTGCTLHT